MTTWPIGYKSKCTRTCVEGELDRSVEEDRARMRDHDESLNGDYFSA